MRHFVKRASIWLSCATAALLVAACGDGPSVTPTPAPEAKAARDRGAALRLASQQALAERATKAAAKAAGSPFKQHGWWWNANEAGTGFAFEAQGDKGFFAIFLYDDTGKPVWLVGLGTLVGDVFSAELRKFSAPPAAGGASPWDFRSAADAGSAGLLRIVFGPGTAIVTLPGGRTINGTRFEFGPGGVAANPVSPELGWWWNPAENGRGYAIEIQGNKAFMAMFHYTAAGTPEWNITDATVTNDGFTGDFLAFAQGQTVTSAYRPAVQQPSRGKVTARFTSACRGTLQFPDGRVIPIEKFSLDGTPNCRFNEPPVSGPKTLAQCLVLPAPGTTVVVNNSTANKTRVHSAGTYKGQPALVRKDYNRDVSITAPSRIQYYGRDFSNLLGTQTFDTAGVLTLDEQYIGRQTPDTLKAGESAEVTYTVKTAFPTGVTDRTVTTTVKYLGDEVVNRAETGINTCRVFTVFKDDAQVDTTFFLAPGVGYIKYAENLRGLASFNGGRNYVQTIDEVTPVPAVLTNSFVDIRVPALDKPSACLAQTAQTVWYASGSNTAANSDFYGVRRVSKAASDPYSGAASIKMSRVLWSSDKSNQERFFSLQPSGWVETTRDTIDTTTQLMTTSEARESGVFPDSLVVGVSTNVTVPQRFYNASRAQTGTGSFTVSVIAFGGHKVHTLAGSFDGCTFLTVQNNGAVSETTFGAGMQYSQESVFTPSSGATDYSEAVKVQR
jgi:hypothetical protein